MTGDEAAAQLAEKLLSETREELTRADGKASLLLAAVGVIAGAVITGFVSAAASPLHLKDSIQWLFWAGVGLAGFGVGGLGVAVWPRVGNGTTGQVRYFADVLVYKNNLEGLKTALVAESEKRLDRDASQLLDVSAIVKRKYRALQVGMVCSGLGALCCVAAWAINSAL